MNALISVLLSVAVLVDAAYLTHRRKAFRSAGGGVTYLVQQGFEGSGYDNGEIWTESASGTRDEDYTTSPIEGSHSLRISGSAQSPSTYVSFTTLDTVYCYFRFRYNAIDSSSRTIATIRDSSGNILATLAHVATTGALRITAQGGTGNSSTDSITAGAGNEIHVWIEYVKGTGSDAIARAGWSTDGTKPTFTAGAAKACVSNNGTVTAQAGRLMLGHTSNGVYDYVFDKVRVDDASIGNSPS